MSMIDITVPRAFKQSPKIFSEKLAAALLFKLHYNTRKPDQRDILHSFHPFQELYKVLTAPTVFT